MTAAADVLLGRLHDPLPPPCALVVFGASGDLAARKLLPALARLALRRDLPVGFALVGVARTQLTDHEFRAFARDAILEAANGKGLPAHAWQDVVDAARYIGGEYDDPATFERLAAVLDDLDHTQGTSGNRLYYLAVPPTVFTTVIDALGRHQLHRPSREGPGAFARVVIEKPYGRDLESAQELDERVHVVFDERDVYRIDHYLGKETVQDVLALRFANAIFEPLWNCRYVDCVQVTVAEAEGVGHRAAFYEQTGALRDIVQNHVMQVLSLALMEPPTTIDAEAIRDEKVKALRAIEAPDIDEAASATVRGQYTDGWIGGVHVPGYLEEPGISPHSTTDTYVALKLHVENWRWAGVPIYVRTGKRLPRRVTEVAVLFQRAPHVPFRPHQTFGLEQNALVLHIQPDEGITLHFGTKVPGRGFDVRSTAMEFLYGSAFPVELPDAYERLLYDAMIGDATLFLRSDEVMEAWRIVTPVLEAWERGEPPLAGYPAGTWGPKEGDLLLERDGRRWWRP